jgi:SHS family lactate transporter-like MFS transporter
VLRIALGEWRRLLYLVLLMVFMMFLSHGTQDLYPDFLGTQHGIAPATVAYVAMFYNVGAIVGAIIFGALSERFGRRFSMVGALGLALVMIPLWAFSSSLAMLAAGAFLLQAGVQGAWGVIPVHLNEMSHDSTRGLVPGLAYQLGILFAAPTNTIEFALRDRVGYQWAIAGFEIVTILALSIIILLGTERRGRSFVESTPVSAD